jgi:hypothetical protein
VRQLFLYFTTRYAPPEPEIQLCLIERVSNLEKIVAECR